PLHRPLPNPWLAPGVSRASPVTSGTLTPGTLTPGTLTPGASPGSLDTPLTRDAGIDVPLIGGAMYPCSNPELVAAVSHAGGIGIVQPLSMIYVHGHDLREGFRLIRRLTDKPVGMNVLIERSSRFYLDRMERWVDAALEAGIRFFIATHECHAHPDYKRAIVEADEDDIVLTERVTGVPLAVIRTPYVERVGTRAGPIARWMLRGRRTKHLMRTIYALNSAWRLKRGSLHATSSKDYWQAGKSVAAINAIEPAGEIVRRFAAAAR